MSRRRRSARADRVRPASSTPDDELLEPEIAEADPLALDDADSDLDDDDPSAVDRSPDAETRPLPVRADRSTDVELFPQDTLSRYFAELGRYPLLSREEEQALALRARDGDVEAAHQLALSNLRLVVKIALEYKRVWANALDLIQEGNVGLVQAVKRFDPDRGVKLSSYAAYWIRAYILKYLIDNIRMVRIGQSRAERKLFFQLNRTKRELEQAGFTPEPKLIAERLDVAERDVVDIQNRLSASDLSLEAPVGDESGGARFGDFLSASTPSAESVVGDEDLRLAFLQQVERFSDGLDEREVAILRERVLADDAKTLQELGDRFGLTRERVRQIEKKMVGDLREYLRENWVDFDYYAPED